jgi:hypothetical protein
MSRNAKAFDRFVASGRQTPARHRHVGCFTPERRPSAAGGLDFYEAVRYAHHLCRTRAEMSAYLRWMRLRVRALVESASWRQPIEALGRCLLQRR